MWTCNNIILFPIGMLGGDQELHLRWFIPGSHMTILGLFWKNVPKGSHLPIHTPSPSLIIRYAWTRTHQTPSLRLIHTHTAMFSTSNYHHLKFMYKQEKRAWDQNYVIHQSTKGLGRVLGRCSERTMDVKLLHFLSNKGSIWNWVEKWPTFFSLVIYPHPKVLLPKKQELGTFYE